MRKTKGKGDNLQKEERIAQARRVIEDYKAGKPGSAEHLLDLFAGVIINAARAFSNKALAGSLAPEKLSRYHKLADSDALRLFRPGINREKYQDYKTDMLAKILEELRARKIPRNPFAYVKTIAWNFGRDKANEEKARSKGELLAPEPGPISNQGRLVETLPDPRVYTLGCDDPPAEDAVFDIALKKRDLLQALDRMPFSKLEALYRRQFPSEKFRGSVEASLDIIDAIYAYKGMLADPDSIPGKFENAWNTLGAAEKKMIPIFGRGAWDRALQAIETGNTWRGSQSGPNLDDYRSFKSLVHAFEEAKSEIDQVRHVSIPDVLFCLSWTAKDGDDRFPDLGNLNISPPRMMFDVWKRAAELKRGKKGVQDNLNKMKVLFWYQKKRAEGTPRERLFQKIRDDSDFENLRKYQYRHPRRNGAQETYRWVMETIYYKCFVLRE